jgi:putative glutathione S-transferase
MGKLIDGVWHDVWYDTARSGGAFVRQASSFRESIDAAEPGRYRLYVSYACPWAHRTLIVRALRGLEAALPVTVTHPVMLERGWLVEDRPLYELYQRADPHYTGRATVPVLWDEQRQTIVNNESSEILRLLDRAFDRLATRACPTLYPEAHRAEIDALNLRIYETVNDGVYRAGFATSQDKHEAAVRALFDSLDFLEQHLRGRRFLVGEALTEADVRLYTTLIRFDCVYHGHFKCNLRRIVDYPVLHAYLARLYALPAFAETTHIDQIKEHYYRSHPTLNPSGIVPLGPAMIV